MVKVNDAIQAAMDAASMFAEHNRSVDKHPSQEYATQVTWKVEATDDCTKGGLSKFQVICPDTGTLPDMATIRHLWKAERELCDCENCRLLHLNTVVRQQTEQVRLEDIETKVVITDARIRRSRSLRKGWRSDPATDKQLQYLQRLGYSGEPPKSKAEAGRLIGDFTKKGARQ